MNCFSIAIYTLINNCYRQYVDCKNTDCYNTLMVRHLLPWVQCVQSRWIVLSDARWSQISTFKKKKNSTKSGFSNNFECGIDEMRTFCILVESFALKKKQCSFSVCLFRSCLWESREKASLSWVVSLILSMQYAVTQHTWIIPFKITNFWKRLKGSH